MAHALHHHSVHLAGHGEGHGLAQLDVLVDREQQLAHRLAEIEGGSAFSHAVQEIFLLNDFNGDGCITRDEWLGSDAVFDALDQDHDGRLTPDDVRLGFGGALSLTAV